jgi:hypothetical protein
MSTGVAMPAKCRALQDRTWFPKTAGLLSGVSIDSRSLIKGALMQRMTMSLASRPRVARLFLILATVIVAACKGGGGSSGY